MTKPTPFLCFDNNAEEAMNFYLSIFPHSNVQSVTRYGGGGPGPVGTVMTAAFQLDGQDFVALNGGPLHKFSEAISFVVNCETQAEVDRFWDKLTAGGGQPGRAMAAMMKMSKLDGDALKRAYDGA